jgi:O-methyltransferase
VFGAGVIGQAVYALLKADHDVVCFFDNYAEPRQSIGGVPVMRPNAETAFDRIYVCVTDPGLRRELGAQLSALGVESAKIRDYREVLLYRARTEFLYALAEDLECREEPFCVAEVGVFRGEFAREINAAFPTRALYLFDTFEGFREDDIRADTAENAVLYAFDGEFGDTSAELVLARMPHAGRVVIRRGYFPDTFDLAAPDGPAAPTDPAAPAARKFGFVSLDADLYAPTAAGLAVFWPRMIDGGVILAHDYQNAALPGVRKAVDEFLPAAKAVKLPIGDAMSVAILKTESE